MFSKQEEAFDVRVFPPLIIAISQFAFSAQPVLAQALDGKAIVTERCASCHDTTGPAPRTYQDVLDRKAPDLFYAGSKFNRAWLVDWLQNPTIIRRAGVMFLNHTAEEGGKDRIVEETVKPCPSDLSRAQAEAAADH